MDATGAAPVDVTQLCLNSLGANLQNFLWQSTNPDAAGYASAVQACQNAGAAVAPAPAPSQTGGGASSSGALSALYTSAVFSAIAALKNPECAAIFNTNPNAANQYDPAAVLASMALGGTAAGIPPGTSFGSITFGVLPLIDAAVTQPDSGSWVNNGSPGGIALSATIIIQSSQLSAGYYGNDTPQQLAMTLIHELGHVFNEVYGLGGSAILYDALPNGRPNWRAERQNAKTLAKCHPQ